MSSLNAWAHFPCNGLRVCLLLCSLRWKFLLGPSSSGSFARGLLCLGVKFWVMAVGGGSPGDHYKLFAKMIYGQDVVVGRRAIYDVSFQLIYRKAPFRLAHLRL